MDSIPDEIWCEIACKLEVDDWKKWIMVCKKFLNMIPLHVMPTEIDGKVVFIGCFGKWDWTTISDNSSQTKYKQKMNEFRRARMKKKPMLKFIKPMQACRNDEAYRLDDIHEIRYNGYLFI
jgi:hypothetical protein